MRLFDYFIGFCIIGLAIVMAVSYNTTISLIGGNIDLISGHSQWISDVMDEVEESKGRDQALLEAAFMLAEQQDMIIMTVNEIITDIEKMD